MYMNVTNKIANNYKSMKCPQIMDRVHILKQTHNTTPDLRERHRSLRVCMGQVGPS